MAIVGGGPAGLAAALWLGRYRRSVRLFDSGSPRNEPAWAVHGYPGLVDPAPTELRSRLGEQALDAGARIRTLEVTHVQGAKDAFLVQDAAGADTAARRIILAYGLRDHLPDVPGLPELYGTSVFHCPDCDGPGVTDLPVGVIGWDRHAAALALFLLTWTDRITLLTHGRNVAFDTHTSDALAHHHIPVCTEVIEQVVGIGGHLTGVEFRSDAPLGLDALFFHLGSEPRCALADQLGCALDDDGYVVTDRGQETSVPGVHAAGDIAGKPHLAAIAAADGIRAALAIHRSLLPESRHL